MDVRSISDERLVRLWAEVMSELRDRELVRSANTPVGDFAERVAAERLGLKLVDNKAATGYDAVDDDGLRYQIKGRRLTSKNGSRQLGAIRDLPKEHFHFLVAVIFDEWLTVREIWKIPHPVVEPHARFSPHVRAHILHLRGPILEHPDVERIV